MGCLFIIEIVEDNRLESKGRGGFKYEESFKEVLIKSLELERDFKGAKPNSQPLRYLFLPYRHTPAKRCLDAGNLACPEAKRFNQHFLKFCNYLFCGGSGWQLGQK